MSKKVSFDSGKVDFLSPTEREHYEGMKKAHETALENIKFSPFRSVRSMNPEQHRRELARVTKILDERTPKKLRPADKNRAFKRYKELGTELRHEMLSKREMHPTRTIKGKVYADMDRAQELATQQTKRILGGQDDKVREFKRLACMLDMSDPTLRLHEKLRRR